MQLFEHLPLVLRQVGLDAGWNSTVSSSRRSGELTSGEGRGIALIESTDNRSGDVILRTE